MKDKVYQDGVYQITNEQYHAAKGISRSQLMLLDKSPYHFWYEVLSGLADKRESTPAMKIGSAFHTLLLEPHLFFDEFCLRPELEEMPPAVLKKDVGAEQYEQIKSARKAVADSNKIIMDDFEEQRANKILLADDQHEKVMLMVEQVSKHEIVKTLLDKAKFEQSIFWTDTDTGIQFKARPDIWSQKMVVDLKTTNDATPWKLQRSALEYGYYLQAGMAYEACKQLGTPFEMFVILAVEKEKPHVPAVFMMDDDALQFGIDQFQKYKEMLATCMSQNKWDPYPVQELSVPTYATKKLENE